MIFGKKIDDKKLMLTYSRPSRYLKWKYYASPKVLFACLSAGKKKEDINEIDEDGFTSFLLVVPEGRLTALRFFLNQARVRQIPGYDLSIGHQI